MTASAAVIAFLSAAIPTFFTPGPNNLMLMASSARFGLRRTVPHMAGICIGFPLMVFVVGLGLGSVLEQLPWLEPVLKYVAAAYLVYMAWTLLGLKIKQADSGRRPLHLYEAVLFQWVNPKAWAMAVSFAALLVAPGPGHMTSLALLTLGCVAIGPFSCLTWMLSGQQLEMWLRRTGSERMLGLALAGLVLLAVVLFLL